MTCTRSLVEVEVVLLLPPQASTAAAWTRPPHHLPTLAAAAAAAQAKAPPPAAEKLEHPKTESPAEDEPLPAIDDDLLQLSPTPKPDSAADLPNLPPAGWAPELVHVSQHICYISDLVK